MTPDQFAYWLRGYFELLEAGNKTDEKISLNAKQTEILNRHVKSVFSERLESPKASSPFSTSSDLVRRTPSDPGAIIC